jgi:hypothetical protein
MQDGGALDGLVIEICPEFEPPDVKCSVKVDVEVAEFRAKLAWKAGGVEVYKIGYPAQVDPGFKESERIIDSA